jgi:hypothetical protein
MSEPVSIAGSSVIAAIAAGFLQVSGIDLPPVLWAAIGAAFMQGHSDEEISRFRVAVHIIGSGLLGGLMAVFFVNLLPTFGDVAMRYATLMTAAVCGFGAQPIMQSLLTKVLKKIEGAAP